MSELILEIFSEEMPANMQLDAANRLSIAIINKLKELNLETDSISYDTIASPRHLGTHIKGLPGSDLPIVIEEEVRGPRLNSPEGAINGFLKKYSLSDISALESREDFFYYKHLIQKGDINSLLIKVLEEVLNSFTWPKSMRWNEFDLSWIRPIHSILCMLDDKVIPLKLGHITADNITYGHRFLSPEAIIINNVEEYYRKLRLANVIVSFRERKNIIIEGINKTLATMNLKLLEDEELLNEIVGLVEYPIVLLGKIDQKFMDLPKEVLITTLKYHQKYLMVEHNDGNLAPYFIIVANTITDDNGDQIIQGNEKVLSARLSDAKFFISFDQQSSLFSKHGKLSRLIFHADIGNMSDKVQRITDLSLRLSHQLGMSNDNMVSRAATLSKIDLVTEMVKEFPELQGIIGYYYALYDGEHKEVAEAIKEHYKPQGPNDSVPTTILGAIIAVADKLDNLQQMFAINLKPTGSKDPHALRRAALGIIRIISQHQLKLSFAELGISTEVINFINERLTNFTDQSYDLSWIKSAL